MPFLHSAFKLSDIQSPSAGRCRDYDDDDDSMIILKDSNPRWYAYGDDSDGIIES